MKNKEISSHQFFWLPSKEDLYCWFINFATISVIYYMLYSEDKLAFLFFFKDTTDELICAKNMDKFDSHEDVRATFPIFTLYSHVIKGLLTVFNSNYLITCISSAVIFSSLSIYLFRRFLIIYGCVDNVFASTIAFCFLTPVGLAFRITATCDTMFLCLMFLSLIFFKTNNTLMLIFSLALSSLTKIEGTVLIVAIFIMALLKKQLIKALLISAEFIAVIIYFAGNKMLSFELLYSLSKCDNLSKDSFGFFTSIFEKKKNTITNLRIVHGVLLIYTVLFLGITGIICSKNRILSIVPICWLIMILFIKTESIIRIALPAMYIALIVGFDSVISTPFSRKAAMAFSILFAIPVDVIYAKNYIKKYNQHAVSLARYL